MSQKTSKEKQKKKKIFLIDPGHGGEDPGAIVKGVREKDLNLEISLRLKEEFEKFSKAFLFELFFTRLEDQTLTLQERVQIENSLKPDFFLSIHCNSFPTDPEVEGMRIYYYKSGLPFCVYFSGGAKLWQLYEEVSLLKANFFVLRKTISPAALLECDFMTNDRARERLQNKAYQETLAKWLLYAFSVFSVSSFLE